MRECMSPCEVPLLLVHKNDCGAENVHQLQGSQQHNGKMLSSHA